MWFEILPSFAIITVALATPGYVVYGLHKAFLGNVSEPSLAFLLSTFEPRLHNKVDWFSFFRILSISVLSQHYVHVLSKQ